MKKVLVFCAHPDDEVLGCGGTLRKLYDKGYKIKIVFVTDGSSGQYKNYEEMISVKKKEALKAGKILGIEEFMYLDFPDMKLDQIPIKDISEKLTDIINKEKPNILFTHSRNCLNSDHRRVYEATLVSIRPITFSIEKVLSYYCPSSTEWFIPYSFSPNFFVNIKDTIKYKIKAFKCYKSENRKSPHPRNAENIKHIAKFFGNFVGTEFVEGFEVVRIFER